MPTNESEAEFLKRYSAQHYNFPAVTVDLVIFTVLNTDLKVLLISRGEHPYKNSLALPGGFLRINDDGGGEDLDDAAYRELFEETGLHRSAVYLEQLQAFGRADRDPRMRVITIAYFALIRPELAPAVVAGGDAAEASWYSVAELQEALELAFDHAEILSSARARLNEKIEDMAFELVPSTFTVTELRAVHEAVKGANHDPSNFRRRFKRMLQDGVIEQAPGKRSTATRPAKVYRLLSTSR